MHKCLVAYLGFRDILVAMCQLQHGGILVRKGRGGKNEKSKMKRKIRKQEWEVNESLYGICVVTTLD